MSNEIDAEVQQIVTFPPKGLMFYDNLNRLLEYLLDEDAKELEWSVIETVCTNEHLLISEIMLDEFV
jgi:hypothetical protein